MKYAITLQTLTLPLASEGIERMLVTLFGGYTRTHGVGEWFDRVRSEIVKEAVTIYTVAFSLTPGNAKVFRDLARKEGRFQRQDEIFITIDGKGEFLDIRTPQVSNQAA